MSNSEFPETRWSRLGRKIGWIFSPILLISLIIFTLTYAEGLKLDINNGAVERKSSVEIKDIKNASIFRDDREIGKTPALFDVVSTTPFQVRVTKEGRKEWRKTVTPRPGFVKTYYPILYPNTIDFKKDQFTSNDIFKNKNNNMFFYEKKENEKTLIYRYTVNKQIFGSNIQNVVYADITQIIRPTLEVEPFDYTVIPSTNGKQLLVLVYGLRAQIIDERGNSVIIPNTIPKPEDVYAWSPNDSYIVFKTNEEIYSFQIATGRLLVIHKPQTVDQTVDIQFLLESNFVYTIESPNVTDLVQNTYDSAHPQKIELPNIDNIRKGNLKKAYDLIEKHNLILIETEENIFRYNTVTFETKKFNTYKHEKIVYIDPQKERILTVNEMNQNQFIFTDLDLEEKKTFTIEDEPVSSTLKSVTAYNLWHNLIIVYEDRIELIDIDGANRVTLRDFKDPMVAAAARTDSNIHLVIRDSLIPGSVSSVEAPAEPHSFVLRVEKFVN